MRLRRHEALKVGCVDLQLAHIADSRLGALEPALLTTPAHKRVKMHCSSRSYFCPCLGLGVLYFL